MTDKKGYYKELGLEKTATTEEIKQTYRKMALKWHPDKNPDNVQQATQVFQKISEAYSVLSDDKKREQYDRFGSVEGFDFDYDDFVGHFDFDGLFNMMFGGMELFSTLGAMGAMDSKHGHSKRKGAGHGFIKTSNKRAQAQMAKMFADPFGMGMNMGGEKKKSKDKEKAKADEGWETEEEYSDDDEDETNTETPAHADKKSAANGDKKDEKTGAKEEESKKKDPVEDKDEDYEDMDEDGDYDDFDEDIDDYGDNMDEETERRINKEMYGEEDEEDFKNFEDFMGKAENMFFLPMFAAENSKDVDKKRTKCNLCKQVMPNDDIFEHMSKQHKKQLDTYIEKAATEDYERDEKRMKNDPFSMLAGAMGGKGMAGMAGMFDMMGGMDVGGKKGKNKKKK